MPYLMKYKFLLWGMGQTYLKRRALLDYEIIKGNIECIAFCARDIMVNKIDKIPVISKHNVNTNH